MEAVALLDAYPLADGHTLVVPRRHVASILDLTAAEQSAVWELATEIARELHGRCDVDGVNIGANIGRSAGQTVDHAHVHVIPRAEGDVEDPRGGVRWVLPAKARYWKR